MTFDFNSFECLENQFLVSMPQLFDPNFNQTVILMCKHDKEGAMGIIINRITEHSIGDIFEQLDITTTSRNYCLYPVLEGGPVCPELGLVVHNDMSTRWESTLRIGENLQLTSSKDILIDMAKGDGPENVVLSLGYAGWSAGQLEHEIQENAWFTTPVDSNILFNNAVEDKWQQSAKLLGIDTNRLSHQVGHA